MNQNYEDYEESLDTSEYDTPDNTSRNKKILLFILVIIGIILIIFLLRACSRKEEKFDPEKTLLDAGKEYYSYNTNEKPKSKSSCKIVELKKLSEDGLLNPDKYSDCDEKNTYVKVCKLENGKMHYVPILSCKELDSNKLYESFKEGKLSEVIADETDIEFSYLIQAHKKDAGEVGETQEFWYGDKIPFENYKLLEKITYYRYQDLQYRWNQNIRVYAPNDTASGGKTLFVSSPQSGYDKKTNEQTAWKWYKSNEGKEYCEGEFTEAPANCPNQDATPVKTMLSREREIMFSTPSVEPFLAKKMYKCIESANKDILGTPAEKDLIFSNEYECGTVANDPIHDYAVESFYSCDGGASRVPQGTTCKCTMGSLRPDGATCALYKPWVEKTTTCTGQSDVCENFGAPKKYYKWYKTITVANNYYPSGSTNASGENSYYAQAPETGYIKDESTQATAWNWYKEISSITEYMTFQPTPYATKTSDSRWTNWTEWNVTPVKSLGNTGTRKIETKVKLKVQEIKNTSKEDYENIGTEYTKDMEVIIKALNEKGYDVETLEDIAMNGELKYLTKMFIRNKK